LNHQVENSNLAPAEDAIVYLVLRNLDGLKLRARSWLLNPANADPVLAERAKSGEIDNDDVVVSILTTSIFRAFAFFDFALQTGSKPLFEEGAKFLLKRTVSLAASTNTVSLWWIARLALNLLDDLWGNSLRAILPKEGPEGASDYGALRELFLAELYGRRVSEVELWPSQIEAAQRATNLTDDLVVALPTSAGKTRVAEIATLMTLSVGKRVLLVTPLRALSAQTERAFRRTFSPLGYTVSSLYGASGMAAGDEDALKTKHIVITTPEKLDFALRSDPTILDDIGLVVLDEGHLIGPSEREIRYEILVQRLLKRQDAGDRRIVCLSAILPDGEQLDDLTAWIRNDAPGSAVRSSWRPTRQRFGTLSWLGRGARLTFDLGDDGPYIRDFVERREAIKPRRTSFPKDNRELTLAAAWRFSEQKKRVLIFCTQRDHVEGYAECVINLNRRGYLASLLEEEADIQRALEVGKEWLGEDHPAVRCLPLGVAIHHGRLPNPFLREVERLLSDGVLKVTIASPTLAQGLNLNAAVLLIPTLYRAGVPLAGEEFANVAGRAGRAFVDVEGLIVHVMYEPKVWRHRAWRDLVNSARARTLQSGLLQIVAEVFHRLGKSGVLSRDDALEYLANSREAWLPTTETDEQEPELLIEKLDATVLGLIDALDSEPDSLAPLIEEALSGSLWARQVARISEDARSAHLAIIEARAKLIWNNTNASQRRGHFAMGVGLDAGLAIDEIADELSSSLVQADTAALQGDAGQLTHALSALAERLLKIRPFAPIDDLPGTWKDILSSWLSGADVSDIGPENMRVIEDAFSYRLVWAIEAVRMRRRALGVSSDFIEGAASACLETGLPQLMMAMLVRAGLPSRRAASAAILGTWPNFIDVSGMNEWLRSNEIAAFTDAGDWPTPETAEIWKQFRDDALSGQIQKWTSRTWLRNTLSDTLMGDLSPDMPHRVEIDEVTGDVWITAPDFRRVIKLRRTLVDRKPSLLYAQFSPDSSQATIVRYGRGRAAWSDA
jgi:hypothetical protein